MADFVLVPGAGCDAEYWGPLAERLADRGHRAVPVQLPCEDDSCGLVEYADRIVDAAYGLTAPVIVAHSFGGFSAPLAVARQGVRALVFASAMIPSPGEKGDDWFGNTGWQAESGDFNALFYSDVDPRQASVFERHQSATPGSQPWPLPTLPDVPTHALIFADDRFFPSGFMRGVVRDRLGIDADTVPGGHLAMLSHPDELATALLSYL
ncbi:alpha/beta hydrolase [Planctomonas sp. JC2975]|uniref:alpha/beta fold hydrolase n=1 Tax=Planctomonas sp. JC2975 TaxID=2729626 RepID=UPI0014744AE1|nr:alpha/beta hydrolase [Planctomonas sp. JC2975]NNC12368.1 alpha/beta hydrolase [Planctomonas sp. JC2975]